MKKIVKCEECFAYTNQGKNHKCDGLMKLLVKYFKENPEKEVKFCPRCQKPMKLNKEESSEYNQVWECCGLALSVG